ncbi:uncharacterized protein LDX57_000378 [Aspergillus melleus]|uniref:uncharacterized protein n=1 Tax=Aspergillus melleus TaxID=138277 RepID=UPI001E8CC350|nr:uncharacterized protein LDX57_000378 [Aspergillus melleus]KAH8422624.1 hypothetical protein LDX57_000378 [Aspergillus melleus]
MVKPLTFKGDKPKKRKTRDHSSTTAATNDIPSAKRAHTDPNPSSALTSATTDENPDDQTWVNADTPTDIAGPVILVLASEPPTCIASDANGKAFASELENTIDGDPGTAEPHDVRQVWVAMKVAGSEAFGFKGHHGKYLGCDTYGIPSATASAISHRESFLVIPGEVPGTFALQTAGGDKENFISVKEVTSSKNVSGKAWEVRGDAEQISFDTTVRIRMQARFKPKIKATKETKAREKVSRKELEEIVGRRLEDDEVKRLKKARREGNFHEEILDVRVKGKHDKFA